MHGVAVARASRMAKWATATLLFCASALSTAALAQESPRDKVRAAIQNELADNSRRSLFAWKERKHRDGHQTEVERIIETPKGVVSRVVLINEKPLTPEQQSQEQERIRKMLDPAQLARKQRERQEDDQRTNKMLSAIPDAFDFQVVGTSESENGHTLMQLKFMPRAAFNPPTRESMVFTGMQGDMLLDETANRLAKIDGTLFKDVTFGWGILGKLYKGGRFVVEQSEVSPNHWDTTRMILHFDGKAVFFKSIHIDEDEKSWDFKPVPPMSPQQALEFIDRDNETQNAQLRR